MATVQQHLAKLRCQIETHRTLRMLRTDTHGRPMKDLHTMEDQKTFKLGNMGFAFSGVNK